MLPRFTKTILHSLVEITPVRRQTRFFCTGVRIHENWILTAAHGVDQVDYLEIKTHATDSASGHAEAPVRVETNRVYIHDRYYEDYSFHDLALVYLPDPKQPVFGLLDGEIPHDKNAPSELNSQAFRIGISLENHQSQFIQCPIEWINLNMTYDPIAKSAFQKELLDMIIFKNESTSVGHSGGPLFTIAETSHGLQATLLAIHSGTKGGPNGSDYGYACAIYSHLSWIHRFTQARQQQRSERALTA